MPLTTDHKKMIEQMEAKLVEAMEGVRKWKHAINAVCEVAGEAPRYDIADETTSTALPGPRYGPSEFYGEPLASVVKRLLEEHGGLTDDQLFDYMKSGGFKFDLNESKAKAGLRISLGKNSAFDKTTSGVYVIAKGRVRSARSATSNANGDSGQAATNNGIEPPPGDEPDDAGILADTEEGAP